MFSKITLSLEKMSTNKGTTDMGVGMGASLGKRPVSTSNIEYLKELAKLKKDGIITEEEFNLKKKQILSL